MGERVRELRQSRGVGQADLARAVGRLPQDVYKWEHGRQVPSDAVPALANALGVSICELYGVDEPHTGLPVTLAVSDRLIQLLDADPERIEINVHFPGDPEQPRPTFSAETSLPAKGARFARRVLDEWESMSEDERQEWRELARTINAREDGTAVKQPE